MSKKTIDTTQLTTKDIKVEIAGAEILKGVSLTLPSGGCIGVVGASGSGKTMFARSVMGLLPALATVSGEYFIGDERLNLEAREREWMRIRGCRIGLVMQDPFTSLDPLTRCGKQIALGVPKEVRDFDVKHALDEVGLSHTVAHRYPFELSGGMRQRVVIAAALATQPDILIADESTSALDVITQKEILDLLDRIRRARRMSLIIITHDLGVVRERTDFVHVFKGGEIIEAGPTEKIISAPETDYTKALLRAASLAVDLSGGADEKSAEGSAQREPAGKQRALLTVEGLTKSFGDMKAVDHADLFVNEREIVGIVGESGSGKTTLARMLVGLTMPDEGNIRFARAHERAESGYDVQIVFQDPYSSLNPALTIYSILTEALKAAHRPLSELDELLDLTELDAEFLPRKPAQLSGGQRQRVALARALAPRPRLLVCDESVSALDVLVQEQILQTLYELREKRGLSILFITHDLGVCRRIANRIYVMYNAKIVEESDTETLFSAPRHPYTRELIDAATLL